MKKTNLTMHYQGNYPNQSEKKKTSQKSPGNLATPTDLSSKQCENIATALNILVANCFALYVKTKNFHWHASGPHYRDYHLLFDEQALEVFNMIDILAERVRKIGQMTIHSIDHIQTLQDIRPDKSDLDIKTMREHLMNDNKLLLKRLREAHGVCSEANDVGSTSILEVFIDETEKRVWFLFETLS